jgi:hypothetical protein
MTKTTLALPLTVLAIILVAVLHAVPAQAQENRTFVSSTGTDGNNCLTTTTPCRHFTAAYAATPAGGEIDVLDPGNYGGLTINCSQERLFNPN